MINMLIKSWIPLQYWVDFRVYSFKTIVLTSLLIILRLVISAPTICYLKILYRIYIEHRLWVLKE